MGKSWRGLLPSDFRAASERVARTYQRALIQPLDRLATFGELVGAMREAAEAPCLTDKHQGARERFPAP